jgi:hypothetical protein
MILHAATSSHPSKLSERAAYLALTTELIRQAAASGMSAVILPSGHKIILHANVVVTVKPKHSRKRRCRT